MDIFCTINGHSYFVKITEDRAWICRGIFSYLPSNNVILFLPFKPNINPQNVVNKIKTYLTFL